MKLNFLLHVTVLLGIVSSVSAQEQAADPKSAGRIFHSMVWTGKEALVWGGGSEGAFFGHGLRIDPAAKGRTAMTEKGAPTGRWGHAGVWTGTEMIVWGGRSRFETEDHYADGARFDPGTDMWNPISAINAPTGRSQMAAVWTGKELLIWGGFGNGAVAWNTGGRYNPKTDKWQSITEVGAPEARAEPLSVWTGKELLVWGGITPDLKRTIHSGARYNPATDKWTPIVANDTSPAVWGTRAVWTGNEMIVWGGSRRNGDDEINEVTRSGGAYDPVRNRWRALTFEGAPAARFFHDAVWTGTRLVVWGGGEQGDASNPAKHYDDGGEYDPVKDRWTSLTWANRPDGRGMHSAIWTGRGMMIFGGSTGGFSAFSDAVLWQPR